MPSNSETLQLIAQVQDLFSQPILSMKKSLQGLSEHGRAVHTEGQKYAKQHAEAFQGLHKTMRETAEQAEGIFQPTMVALGISAIGTGTAIAALAKGIKDLGAYGKEMSFASHETGLAINSLNAWIEAGKRANITSDAMIGSLTSTNEKLSQFEKRRDSALQQFFAVNMDKPVMAKLEHDLRAAKGDREKQDRLILETYGKLQEADQHLLEEAFGEQNFRRFNSKDIDDSVGKLHRFTDQEIADLKRQQEAFDDTVAAARKFATEIELSLSKPMKEAVDAVGTFLNEHGEEMKSFLATVAEDIKSADWDGFAKGIGKTATETKKLIDAVGGANVFQGLIALKLGGVPGLAALLAYKGASAAKEKLDESGVASGLDRKKGESVGDWLGRLAVPPGTKMLRDKPIWDEDAPTPEKESFRGRIPDIQKPDMGGLQKAAYRTGEETPGAEIRAEAVMTRATMRGTAEGSRIGTLAAFHEWMDEQKRGAGGGGVVPAAYIIQEKELAARAASVAAMAASAGVLGGGLGGGGSSCARRGRNGARRPRHGQRSVWRNR